MLRKLKKDDAKYMMEFCKDNEISKSFKFTRKDCSINKFNSFIERSWDDSENKHFAIENSNNEFVGTVSLKNISYIDGNAEYSIVTLRKFWGSGIAKFATRKIIDIAFNELGLRKIYLNVISTNKRAIKFYEKLGFEFEGVFTNHILFGNNHIDLLWYCIFKENWKGE